ncbi:hypothetical protein AX17_003945 [Amanita inopinata Kibby_2008]|nr:hypothetical protein AX17_003945 [Amanita inopinata Kibby_2008]
MRVALSDYLRLLSAALIGALAAVYYLSYIPSSSPTTTTMPMSPPTPTSPAMATTTTPSTTTTLQNIRDNATNPLTSWFVTHTEALHSQLPPGDNLLQDAFKAMFADEAKIVVNHEQVSVREYWEEVEKRRFAVVGESVEWRDVLERAGTGTGGGDGEGEEGIVAGSYVLTRSLKFRVRVTPAQTTSHVVFSAKVRKWQGEERRIVEMFVTSVDKPVPVHFQHVPLQNAPVV